MHQGAPQLCRLQAARAATASSPNSRHMNNVKEDRVVQARACTWLDSKAHTPQRQGHGTQDNLFCYAVALTVHVTVLLGCTRPHPYTTAFSCLARRRHKRLSHSATLRQAVRRPGHAAGPAAGDLQRTAAATAVCSSPSGCQQCSCTTGPPGTRTAAAATAFTAHVRQGRAGAHCCRWGPAPLLPPSLPPLPPATCRDTPSPAAAPAARRRGQHPRRRQQRLGARRRCQTTPTIIVDKPPPIGPAPDVRHRQPVQLHVRQQRHGLLPSDTSQVRTAGLGCC